MTCLPRSRPRKLALPGRPPRIQGVGMLPRHDRRARTKPKVDDNVEQDGVIIAVVTLKHVNFSKGVPSKRLANGAPETAIQSDFQTTQRRADT